MIIASCNPGDSMTVKLVKRKEAASAEEKPPQPSSPNQLILTTQGWVEEFKARKARTGHSIVAFFKRN